MNGITLVTPTGGRQEAFRLCELYISRQTYQGPLQWICSDDCEPRTEFTLPCQEVIRPPWIWQPGDNTQGRNLLMLLDRVRYDIVVFVEDDEWYAPGFLADIAQRLEHARIVGEGRAKYYNVDFMSWYINGNTRHACLARTGIRAELIPNVQRIARDGSKFIDVDLWRSVPNSANGVYFNQLLSVGIKGMPGKPGIGTGHRRNNPSMQPDPTGKMLRSWIRDDYELYVPFFHHGRS